MHNAVSESAPSGGVTSFGAALTNQIILGADFRFIKGNFDYLAAYYNIRNENKVIAPGVTQNKNTGRAYYVQFGYRITEPFKLVYRFETLRIDKDDTYFKLLGTSEYKNHVVTLRYDLDESNALMFEAVRTEPAGGDSYTTFMLDWAFLMF